MIARADAIDLDLDLREARRQRMRRFVRVAVPILTLLILLASILAIATYLYRANHADARELTDDLLQELDRRIVAEVVEFLEPAALVVRLAERLAGERALDAASEPVVESFALHVLESNPQLASVYFADPRGDFLMYRRVSDGSIQTKRLERRGARVESTWIKRDPEGRVIATGRDPADTFDPRTRPWYQGAARSGALYWSDVYIFFTEQHPGITASLPLVDANGTLAAVYAVDIALADLSTFLGELEIGRQGRALIIDDRGVLVAYPVMEKMLNKVDDEVERAHIEDLADPVLNRAFDRLRVDGPGKRELRIEGRRYINTATSLEPVLGRAWTLITVVPEEDFVGFVAENNRRGLYMSAAVLLLASVLAGLLVVQGLRADRNAQLVAERQDQLASQSHAFSRLASQAAVFDSEDASSIQVLTEIVASTVRARRISVWQLTNDGRRLECEDAFDKESGGHTAGVSFNVDQLPQYFQSLERGDEIVAPEAADDPLTAELHRLYLHPLGSRGILSLPIRGGEDVLGALWLESDDPRADGLSADLGFARAVANLVALRMSRGEDRAPSKPPVAAAGEIGDRAGPAGPMRETALVGERRAQAFLARLERERTEGAAVLAEIFEDVTAVVIQFTNPISLAAPVDGAARSAVDDLVSNLELLAAEHGADYLKLLGDEVVCAAGFAEDPQSGVEAMAGFAIGAHEHASRLFSVIERPMEFRIGIDTGPVIGSAVGRERSVFNLWGEAVRTAARMAQTGVLGQIHVTESTYRRLRESFLFRVRGRYYLEGFGEFTTYFLTGRV